MPIYVYHCPSCQQKLDIIKPIALLDREETCRCGDKMFRVMQAPAVRGDYEGYSCPITGDWIQGRRAHLENLAKHNCRLLEDGERQETDRAIANRRLALDKQVDEFVEKEIHEMPAEKREKLVAEVEAGLTPTVTRGTGD